MHTIPNKLADIGSHLYQWILSESNHLIVREIYRMTTTEEKSAFEKDNVEQIAQVLGASECEWQEIFKRASRAENGTYAAMLFLVASMVSGRNSAMYDWLYLNGQAPVLKETSPSKMMKEFELWLFSQDKFPVWSVEADHI